MAVFKLHQTLLEDLRNQKKLIYFVDLDSTVYSLTHRQLQIFSEFASVKQHQELLPEETKAFASLSVEHMSFYPKDCLKNYGLKSISSAFDEVFYPFWSERFFSNNYLKYDVKEEGSVEFIQEIYDHGGDVHYLTGRDVERMREGTIAKLQEDGLFLKEGLDSERIKLVMKPEKSIDDAQFKHDHMAKTLEKYHKGVLIDNEPANLHIIKHLFDKIHLVHYDSFHMGNMEIPEEALVLENFSLWAKSK